MALTDLADALPSYASDIADSLRVLARDDAISARRRDACLLACATAIGEPRLLERLGDGDLDGSWREAARIAAVLLAMNSVYYRAVSSMETPQYGTMPARLGMKKLGAPPIPKTDFDLLCLSVAALFGCGTCLDAHEKELRTGGADPAVMQAALRIAALTHASAVALRAEKARE
ncbi:MAG: carboxymuconolactone decarboxylase family protein [Caulobacteraceae bacterium]|nr:carboxymuconolactone decarboxylase family protein [Caulobacter sp.]